MIVHGHVEFAEFDDLNGVTFQIGPQETGVQVIAARLQADIDSGLRQEDILARSLARLPLYDQLQTHKIDTTHLTIKQTAEAIAKVVQTKE